MHSGTSKSTLTVSGRVHLDYWGFSNTSGAIDQMAGTQAVPLDPQDRIGFRRLRFGVKGNVTDNMEYKIEMDFASPAGLAVLVAVAEISGLVGPDGNRDRYEPVRVIRLDEPGAGQGTTSVLTHTRPAVLRVAIAPVISPEKSLRLYANLVDYLAEQLDRTPVVLQRETYLEVNDLVRYGRCDVALVCTYAFVRREKEFGMGAIAVPQVKGHVTYNSLIVVPKSSTASSLLDLRGKRFASADLLSNSGWLYPATWLKKNGGDPENFFRRHVITGSHDQSISAVVRQFVDGAAVDSLVYEQMVAEDPAIAEQMRVIDRSPPYGMPPLVVSPRLSPQLKRQLREALLKVHESPAGRRVLGSLGIDRFVAADDSLYDGVRSAAEQLESNP